MFNVIVTVNKMFWQTIQSVGKNDDMFLLQLMTRLVSQVSLLIQKYGGFFQCASRVLRKIMTLKSNYKSLKAFTGKGYIHFIT